MSCKTFPYDACSETAYQGNPAIRLFGNRMFRDQTSMEFLVEFLLLVVSRKTIESETIDTTFPSIAFLRNWDNSELKYSPKARLNLKLFSFLSACRIDSRHLTHRKHHEELLQSLSNRIQMTDPGKKEDVIRTLEHLFLGFQGAGGGRTWCAQSFLPISQGFLAGETIWNESAARRKPPSDWSNVLDSLSTFMTMNKHRFLARGGEVLYLQICNALGQPEKKIREWVRDKGLEFSTDEQNPEWLHSQLEHELEMLMTHCPDGVTEIAEFIDGGLDPETPEKTDGTTNNPRLVKAGWCPTESWQEGYLFAVDLLRLCQASLGVVERLYLLETESSLHVLRSLAMQSARYVDSNYENAWPGYCLAVSNPEEGRPALKRISRYTVRAIEKQIFKAIRQSPGNLPQDKQALEKSLKDADKRYGAKLFVGLAKRIGFIVPRRGAGARFVLTEQLLRLLVLTTVSPGSRMTFDTFKRLVALKYGLVFDADGFREASRWVGGTEVYLPSDTDNWLKEMLEAAGLLIHLSDSCSLVKNPSEKIG